MSQHRADVYVYWARNRPSTRRSYLNPRPAHGYLSNHSRTCTRSTLVHSNQRGGYISILATYTYNCHTTVNRVRELRQESAPTGRCVHLICQLITYQRLAYTPLLRNYIKSVRPINDLLAVCTCLSHNNT